MCSTGAKRSPCCLPSRSRSTPSQSSSLRPPDPSERSCRRSHPHSSEQRTTFQCSQRHWWGWRGKSQRHPVTALPTSAVRFEPRQHRSGSWEKRALRSEGWVAWVKRGEESIARCIQSIMHHYQASETDVKPDSEQKKRNASQQEYIKLK